MLKKKLSIIVFIMIVVIALTLPIAKADDETTQTSEAVTISEEENTENAEISTPVNAPKVTSIRVETYGIDYGTPKTVEPFNYYNWLMKQYSSSSSSNK